jgi:hypothetical protein
VISREAKMLGGYGTDDATDRNVEMWKMKKLIKSLEMARG